MAIILLLSGVVTTAQIKNMKTETVKIYGNCGMCKKTIEKAANVKDIITVVWNKDTKMAVSFVVVYLVMFLNVAEFSHILISLTRLYMTTLMISTMAITMLLFMWKMYPNRKINMGIVAFAAVSFFGTLYL